MPAGVHNKLFVALVNVLFRCSEESPFVSGNVKYFIINYLFIDLICVKGHGVMSVDDVRDRGL